MDFRATACFLFALSRRDGAPWIVAVEISLRDRSSFFPRSSPRINFERNLDLPPARACDAATTVALLARFKATVFFFLACWSSSCCLVLLSTLVKDCRDDTASKISFDFIFVIMLVLFSVRCSSLEVWSLVSVLLEGGTKASCCCKTMLLRSDKNLFGGAASSPIIIMTLSIEA